MALLPPFFLDCVVAIGIKDPKSGEKSWIATGFLYGYLNRVEKDGKKNYLVGLITNRHVFENQQEVTLRFNTKKDEPAREYRLILHNEKNEPQWFAHSNSEIDVAVIPIPFTLLEEDGIKAAYFFSDEHAADTEKMNELGITEGDFAYVLGFPMGIIGGEKNRAIVRSGSIARIQDALAGASIDYLLDIFIFPGNSGGPVISKPEAIAIKGTKSQAAAHLIGIVKEYISYQDIAISVQTDRPRVVFEENSGLAAVHPVDFIHEIIEKSLESMEK